MAATNAERQRRFRRHKQGDHTLCDPKRCDGVTASPVTPTVTVAGERGRRLWRDEGGDELSGGRRALLEEACRIADRLDRLDAVLNGSVEDWLGFVESKGFPDRQEIVIDKPLAEARQQAVALKQIVSELRQTAAPAAKPVKTQGGGVVSAGVADLTSRIAERRAQAQG